MTLHTPSRPRVGVPWRTVKEERDGKRNKVEKYLRAVERAGAEPVLISLLLAPEQLKQEAAQLDAFVLTGSPADVNPARFGAKRHPATTDPDEERERTDFALLEQAFSACKPVLAICYGIQSLNVFLGGSLVQDIPSELRSTICHSPIENTPPGQADPTHGAQFEVGRVLDLSGKRETQVNSSHHQSVLEAGRGLRVTARAPDGVVEAVEWTDDANWVVGIQWHPERMPGDALALALFDTLVARAKEVNPAK